MCDGMIGPAACSYCGGEYGEHDPCCPKILRRALEAIELGLEHTRTSLAEYDDTPCPLQEAIEHVGLSNVIVENAVKRLMVSEVRFLPDIPYRPARVHTSRDGTRTFNEPERLGEYGDLVVVFKVLEKSQE